jgi:predicted dinucleotide-binding enzyme
MRIATVGAGRVGRALGLRWSAAGHQVVFGVRDPGAARHSDLPAVADLTAAVTDADVVLIAVPWHATEAVLAGLDVGDAVVIDATNPLVGADTAAISGDLRSGAERIAEWTGSARVVKAFNTTGSGNMVDPSYPSGRPAMFLAGDDLDACAQVEELAAVVGFDPVRTGGLDTARDLEHLALIWIRLAYPLGQGPDIAVALLRR